MSELIDAVIANVRSIASENPEFIYVEQDSAGCTYVRDGKPDCLMGQALVKTGVSVKSLEAFDVSIQSSSISYVITAIMANYTSYNVGLTEDENSKILWLGFVQYLQDTGVPWANAVREADLTYPLDTAYEDKI